MAYYLKLPPHSGNQLTNNFLVQISGLSGTLNSIEYTLAESITEPTGIAAYIFDIRRSLNSTANGGGVGYILRTATNAYNTDGTSGWRKNGTPVTFNNLFFGSADDVISFNVGVAASAGTIALFARFNEVEHFFNLAVKEIKITVAGVVHTFNMSSSNGNLNEFTSDTGTLTFKLFNAPANNSQWVFYDDGGEQPSQTLFKYWNGSSWVSKPLKMWNGSSWIAAPVKRWNGSAWVQV